jgi:hypothetical protein
VSAARVWRPAARSAAQMSTQASVGLFGAASGGAPDIRRWRRRLIAIGILLALLQLFRTFHGAQTRFITNDGDWYYAYLCSLYFDHDLDLSNQMAVTRAWGPVARSAAQMATWQRTARSPEPPIPSGQPTPTAFTVGPAILWAPAFAAADGAVWAANHVGGSIPRNGYSMPYQLAVALATLAYGLFGVWLALRATLRWAGETAGCSRGSAALAAVIALCASPALYYLVFEPTMAHGVSIFAASALVWLWVSRADSPGWRRWVAIGLAGGLCALIRPQDSLLLLLPLSTLIALRGADLVVSASALAVGAALAFLPQALVWQATFGRPFAVPQGPDFLQWTRPAFPQIWFSVHHGLFTWTPVFLLGVVGLALSPKGLRRFAVPMLIVFLLESYVNSAARDWWGGDAFGARRFLSLFPVFAWGLSIVACRLSRRPAVFAAIAVILTAANLALMAAYVTGRIAHG